MEFNTDFGWLTKWEKLSNIAVTWEYNCFSFLLATWDVLPGGMSAPQRQKFHTDDVNQGLLNKSGSHGVPNVNLFDFMFLLVDYGKVLCSTANEVPQMLFPKRNIFQKYWLICITFITFKTQGRGGYLGKFLLGMCCWPLRAPALLSSILWPIIDTILVTFGKMCNFRDPNLVTFYSYELTHFLDWLKNTLLFICSTNTLVRLLTVNMENCLTPKNPKMCDPILVTLSKMWSYYS